MEQVVQALFSPPANRRKLQDAIQSAWYRIPQERFQGLAASLP